MNHITFTKDTSQVRIAILIKNSYFNSDKIKEYYANYLQEKGITLEEIIVFSLYQEKKLTISKAKQYLNNLLPALVKLNISHVYCADATYFKALTKQTKAEPHYGYMFNCALPVYEYLNITLGTNYGQLIYNPNLMDKLRLSLDTLVNSYKGMTNSLGKNIIEYEDYPSTVEDIQTQLNNLLHKPLLTCDIETKGLTLQPNNLISIAFAWNKHEGIAFKILDKNQLKLFFEKYQGTLIFHNASFDIKQLIYALFMQHPIDYRGLLYGLSVFNKIHDTKVIAYLATNNTQGNELGLKKLVHNYLGNYAEDVTDTSKIPLKDLLNYDLKDCLGTFYVYEKYFPILIKDNQLNIYNELMLPSLKTIIQMELVGMPINSQRLVAVKTQLEQLRDSTLAIITQHPSVLHAQTQLQQVELDRINSKLKTKQHGFERVQHYLFNPNSNSHMQYLIYEVLQLPVIDYTQSKAPAVGTKTLIKLCNHTEKHKELLQAFVDYIGVNKVLTTFIPAFEKAPKLLPTTQFLQGNFNLGGTLSGRLSCVAAWTMITTNQGNKPIIDIKVGDLVWTHKERWKPVTNTIYKGIEDMVDIHLVNGEIFTCTVNHKVLLADGQWKSIKELLNVNIKDLDKKSRKYKTMFRFIQKYRKRNDYTKYSRLSKQYTAQCQSCTKNTHDYTRVQSNSKGKVFFIKNWLQKPNERQCERITSQLYWRMFKSKRLFNKNISWKKRICSSYNCNAASRFNRITCKYRHTPYRWQPFKQLFKQFGVMYKRRSSQYPLLAGKGQQGLRIKEINYCGSHEVYDISVADDESYLSHGFYSHNSSKPNLQNLPSGSNYGKLIKSCFQAPKGYILVGADFSSLEDRINALLTKDDNKLKVYIDGYDGHCLRAYAYFKDKMPDIQQATHERCFQVDDITFKETDKIKYQNTIYTGLEFYEKYSTKDIEQC